MFEGTKIQGCHQVAGIHTAGGWQSQGEAADSKVEKVQWGSLSKILSSETVPDLIPIP